MHIIEPTEKLRSQAKEFAIAMMAQQLLAGGICVDDRAAVDAFIADVFDPIYRKFTDQAIEAAHRAATE